MSLHLPFKRLNSRKPKPVLERDVSVDSVEILYEDESVMAVNKPACLPMHANLDPQREHLVGILTRQLERRDGSCGYLGVHQRLDWGTSGVVLFTRAKDANASIAQQFASHSLKKVYIALVHGHLWKTKGNKRVTVPLGEPERRGGRVSLGTEGALPAATVFKLLQIGKSSAWAEALLETGRKHQVRAHLFSLGVHIYGDLLYGGKLLPLAQRPMLHAVQLTFVHPRSGREITVAAQIPDDMKRLSFHLGLNLPAALCGFSSGSANIFH